MIDTNSPSWLLIEERLTRRLAHLREQLEEPGLPFVETEALRAQIAECKNLLRLPAVLAAEDMSGGPVQSPIAGLDFQD